MRSDVAEALRRLREADPAARVADEPWTGSAAEALTRAPEGEHSVDAVPPATRRARRWPAVLAAAAVVAGISVAAVELSDGHDASRRPLAAPTGSPSHSQPAPPVVPTGSGSPSSSTPPGIPRPDPHKVEAERFVRHLLRNAPVLPGAQRRATAPDAELRHAVGRPRNSNPVSSGGIFFTASGTMDEAIAYLRRHVPPGMMFDGTGTGSRYGVVTSKSIDYVVWNVGNLRDSYLNIFVAPYRGGVGIGMYAEASWIPSRPPGSSIEGATSVSVTVRRGGAKPANPQLPHAPTVHRILSGADVDELARIVNRLQPQTPGVRSCPAGSFKFDDALVFATPTGSVRAVDSITGCPGVALDLADGRHLYLDPGGLDAAVLHALGLPRNYGSR